MIKNFIRENLRDKLNEIKDEWLKAYNGRYLFDVKKAYTLIENKQIEFTIKKFASFMLKQFSHPEFSQTNVEKVAKLKKTIDYTKPLGLLVKFKNPDTNISEWILIDGNHRVRAAAENDMDGLLYVISNPDEVAQFLEFNKDVPHELFADDEVA